MLSRVRVTCMCVCQYVLYVSHVCVKSTQHAHRALTQHTHTARTHICPQDKCADTSRAEITRRVDCARGKRHFTKWTNKELDEAIKACGLACSKFGNKKKKCGIVHHLSITDLPTDMGAVWRKIQTDSINPTGATSPQQRAYLLLCHMAVGLTPPKPKEPTRKLIAPSRILLAAEARLQLWDRLHEDICVFILFIIIYYCLLSLFIIIYYYLLLFIVIYYCSLSFIIIIYYYLSSFIVIYCHYFIIYHCLLLFIVIYCH